MNLKKEIEKLEKNGWLENTSDIDIEKLNEVIERRTTPKCDEDIFKSLNLFSMKETNVLIIGQDPYPDKEKAHGLAFSYGNNEKPPKDSLENIFKALPNKNPNRDTNLEEWATTDNKVLLLNSALTYKKGENHFSIWKDFTKVIIIELLQCKAKEKLAVFLWGRFAQKLFLAALNEADIKNIQSKIDIHKDSPCKDIKCKNGKKFKTNNKLIRGKMIISYNNKETIEVFMTSHPSDLAIKQGFENDAPRHFKECDKFLKKDIWKNL